MPFKTWQESPSIVKLRTPLIDLLNEFLSGTRVLKETMTVEDYLGTVTFMASYRPIESNVTQSLISDTVDGCRPHS